MENKKNISLFMLIILIVISINNISAAKAIDYDRTNIYVTDKADVLSKDTIDHIISVNNKLKKTGAEVVVLTVNGLNGQDIKSFSTEIFEDWGIGSKEKDNGLLIVLDVEQRAVEVEVGYGLEGPIPDSKVVRILKEEFAPSAENDDFDTAIVNTFNKYVLEIMNEYDIEDIDDLDVKDLDRRFNIPPFIAIIILLIIITIIFNILGKNDDDDNFRGGGGRPRRTYRRYYGGFGVPPRTGRAPWGGGSSGGNNSGGLGGGRSGGGGGGINF